MLSYFCLLFGYPFLKEVKAITVNKVHGVSESISKIEQKYQVDIESMSIEGDIEIDFVPKSMVWLGIAEEGEGHDH